MAISTIGADGLASSSVTRAKMGYAGAVLQVVQASYSTQVTNSSSTFATTGLSASITPTSSSNKILVLANVAVYYGSANNMYLGLRINRGGSFPWTNYFFNNVGAIVMLNNTYGINYLDSPATTSSTTYTIEFNCPSSASAYAYPTAQLLSAGNQSQSTITLLEVAA